MGSRELERNNLRVPLDHLTRFDKMIEESNGESMVQVGIQGIFYLFIIRDSVYLYGPGAETAVTFADIRFSILISLLSLANGKFKANELNTEYSSTTAQKLIYFLASLANSVSSVFILVHLLFCMGDLTHVLVPEDEDVIRKSPVLLAILLLPPFFSFLRIPSRKLQLSKEAWSNALCSPGPATTNPYSNCLESLQIQPSKMKLGDRYLQMNAYSVLLMENIQSHIIFTLSNLAIPLLCTLLHFHNPENFPIDAAFSFGSSDLTRFQRASCVLIPSGWILSQILILVYFYIDSGVQTCGIDFHFDNSKAGDEERPQQLSRVPTYQVRTNEEIEMAVFSRLFQAEVKFESESGRWILMEGDNNGEDVEDPEGIGGVAGAV